MYVKYVQSILYVSIIYTYSVYLVSLNGLVFKNVNFFQTKGTSALTYMFADVHIPMNLLLDAIGEICQTLKFSTRRDKFRLRKGITSF